MNDNGRRDRNEKVIQTGEMPAERVARGEAEVAERERTDVNPPHTTSGNVTAPKFGSAGSGGAELEGPLKKN